ncbi:hypothetical protein CUBB_gp21 [Staphylococcus phage CUB-B]|nr:hypothetical protein CUBB_gp21 [Staphylococcus phage CUB-B]
MWAIYLYTERLVLDTEWRDTTIRSLRSDIKPLPGNIRYLSYVRLTKPLEGCTPSLITSNLREIGFTQ